MRELIFAVTLVVSAAAITVGVALIQPEAGWVVGGVLFGMWSWLVLGETE